MENAINHSPNDTDLRIQYADTLRMAGRSSDGLAQIEQVLRDEPTHPVALRIFGRMLLDLGRVDEAAAQFERALAVDPNSVDAAVDLAQARDQQARPLAALHTIRDALARNEVRPLRVDYAWRLASLAAWPEAIECARRAVELYPDSAEPHGVLSWLLLMIGVNKEALAARRRR